MKKRRNFSMSKIFWASLVLMFILGLILQLLGIKPMTFPEEDSSQTSSTLSVETESTNTSNEAKETIPVETISPETTPSTSEAETERTESTDSKDSEIEVETEIDSETEIETETKPEPETVPEPSEEPEYVGTIYLTFDDGPSLESTPQILDILKANNISATFFILDYEHSSEKEKLVIRAFNEGHTIALHGTSHQYSEIYTSLDALIKNFETIQEKVYVSTGHVSNIIRFPGGSSNTVSKYYCTGIMSEAVEYFSTTDFRYFDWNVDSQDAGGAYSVEEIYENVTSSIKKGRNNVVLMHDSNSKKYTVEALQSIIDWALAEGYEFKAITEDTPQVKHRIAN